MFSRKKKEIFLQSWLKFEAEPSSSSEANAVTAVFLAKQTLDYYSC